MSYPVFSVPAGDVIPVMFNTYAGSTGASVTLTGLAVTDIEIYKDGSATQRASDAGYTLLDTDGIDFDTITGIHGFSINTGDNTDAGFYTVGAWFTVVVSAITVDAQTVNFIACQFRLMAAESIAAKPKVDVDGWLGTACATPTVAGVPEIDVTHIGGDAQSATDLKDFADAGYDPVTNKVQGVVLTDTLTTYTGNTPQTGDSFARIGATGSGLTSLASAANLTTAQADLDNIQTRLPSNFITGTADSGTTTTMVDAARTEADTDYWRGQAIVFTSGSMSGQARLITGFNAATDTITFSPATTQAVGTNTYEIWPAAHVTIEASSAASIVDQVWDEATSGHATAGTTGKALTDAGSAGDPWATAIPGAYGAGTAGKIVGDNINATVSSRASAANLATAQTDIDDIQSRLPAALVGGRMDANTSAIGGVATAAVRLARSTQAIVTGTVGAASTTTSIVTSALDPASAVIDQFKGRIVTFDQATTTANLRGQATDITASTAAGVLTVTALTTAPVSGDTFTIT